MIKKSLVAILSLSSIMWGTEFQYGNGTFNMEGGFLGLTGSIDTDIASYSIVDRHSNIGDNLFYGYDLTWYDSKDLIQAQKTYNDFASKISIPSMEYRLKGLDANLRVGYDVIHQDKDNFLGIGAIVGISMPWIDATKNDNTTPDLGSISSDIGGMISAEDMFKNSKTEIMTYKIGPTVTFQKALVEKKLSVYGGGSYAYQTGNIKNDLINSDFSVDGTYQEYNLGLYFTPFTETFKWGWLTLNPRIYATIGYKYSKWEVDKMVINTSGQKFDSDKLMPFKKEFNMDTSIGYFGIGYSF